MTADPFRIQVEISPARVRAAVVQSLRALAAGTGVEVVGAQVFFKEAAEIVAELLSDLSLDYASEETLQELANRVTHLLVASTLVGFRALVMLEDSTAGGFDYVEALAEIEAEIARAYPDPDLDSGDA
jgi:hypothetical protein